MLAFNGNAMDIVYKKTLKVYNLLCYTVFWYMSGPLSKANRELNKSLYDSVRKQRVKTFL